ncbi:MAG TPA: ABC transporter ATP-binding protein [Burkholderiaceae bacterium]|nr:ABC transporter ATP-binding protein [Burkholderiaceae bacterium]
MPGTARLRIEEVGRRYGDVVALAPTSLDVAAGEFLTLLGPSGSGKTTLLSIVAGLVEPDHGCVQLDGRDITRTAPHARGLGMVFQHYALFPHLSVAENVAFGLQARRLPAAEVAQRTRQALDMVRLASLANRLPREVSGGQQQRVALARALAYQPAVVLMDEPLGALDRHLREEMKAEIARLHRQLGVTVLYVTHDQEEALTLSDRICLMREARIEQLDTPHALYLAPRTRFAAEFLGESNLLEARWEGAALRLAGLGTEVPAGAIAPGTPAFALLRPESIELAPADAAPAGAWRGRVVGCSFLGAWTRWEVLSGETLFAVLQPTRASTRRDAQPQEGAEVALFAPPGALHAVAA